MAIAAGNQTDERRIEFEILYRGQHRDLDLAEPFILKIDTEEEWAEFWNTNHRTIFNRGRNSPVLDSAALDFADHMLLAIYYVPVPNSRYSMITQRITAREDVLVVQAQRRISSDGCGSLPTASFPFRIVQAERVDLDPELLVGEQRVNCR
ncbi:MAG: hypothetical protein ACE5FA_05000 [Dehalococcoidia bacterium]